MNLEFEVDGFDEALTFRVRAEQGVKREVQDMLGDAAKHALNYMRLHVPRGANPDPYHRTIYSSLDMDGLVYRPGGLGGGGFWEINVGAIRNPPEHLAHVFEGTRGFPANWRVRNRGRGYESTQGSRGSAKPKGNMGTVMAIQKLGEPVRFRTRRRGQKPQTAWFTGAAARANAYIAARIQQIDLLR